MFPNPVSDWATVSYSLPRTSAVSCIVYDAAGNAVARLAAGIQTAGEHRLTWNAAGVKPGVYFCKFVGDNSTSTARLALVR